MRDPCRINHHHYSGVESDEVPLGHRKSPAIRKPQDKRMEAVLKTLSDLIHNHAAKLQAFRPLDKSQQSPANSCSNLTQRFGHRRRKNLAHIAFQSQRYLSQFIMLSRTAVDNHIMGPLPGGDQRYVRGWID